MGKIWTKVFGAEPRTPAENVLSSCGRLGSVDCWESSKRTLRLAVFLQHHPKDSSPAAQMHAKLCIAYESFHPAPVQFTRKLACEGGTLGKHDPDKVLELPAGRSGGRNYRSEILPTVVGVDRDPESAAKVDAHVTFADSRPSLDADPFMLSVTFPSGGALRCSCC